jgi:hypothetical protein
LEKALQQICFAPPCLQAGLYVDFDRLKAAVKVLQQRKTENLFTCEIETTYLQAGLHVDFDRLKAAVIDALKNTEADRIILLYGSKCHPEFHKLLDGTDIITFKQANCIELILGDRMQEIDRLFRTFYLTPGWMLCWREIFEQGLHWDEVDMRQSFGFFDQILLLDTDVGEITGEQVLEFFERTRVPIKVEKVGLAGFKGNIIAAMERVLATGSGANCLENVPPFSSASGVAPASGHPGGMGFCPLIEIARHFRCKLPSDSD